MTKISFNSKTYSDGQYKDGTIHITVDSGHNAKHPSPINPNPLTHVLGIAMLHYTNPEARTVAFAQSYSFKAGLKKFGKVGETDTDPIAHLRGLPPSLRKITPPQKMPASPLVTHEYC
jgi:hypothetical protein